ncbi:hypothetical protein QBC33DRAFT_530334 [Phialemonium atrogriseum]|uniref:DUF7779 domain-containing protein n=1 Tax=Phialemonium atrogriseum TaxID=1093897 RepID=A0AAJ0FPE6_9PEZI|nr:uncharacterized protein QBC33DRAFT_530334 [Phialemonium atrogriseum]KAK1770188.1 hypothetical protein QBC33DRAFT_530334 [Phialemonium atrogriseum]
MESVEASENHLPQWQSTLARCLEGHEPYDIKEISETETHAQDVRKFLNSLARDDKSSPHVREASFIILPYLVHFEAVSDFFAENLGPRFDTSPVWAMFLLVTKLASEMPYPEAFRQIAVMIKRIGQKIDLFNEYSKGEDVKPKQMNEAALDIQIELAGFFSTVIRFFRHEGTSDPSATTWDKAHGNSWNGTITKAYNLSQASMTEIFQRIEKLALFATKRTRAEDLRSQEALLAPPSEAVSEEPKKRCIMIPRAGNDFFFDRDGIIDKIDEAFYPTSGQPKVTSLLLHGIGGVGKSYVAMKYARHKTDHHILFLIAESKGSLAQSITDAAVMLDLPRAAIDKDEMNRIILFRWFQETKDPWLLIFDNAESKDLLLKYWPPSFTTGRILITSRNRNLQFAPADKGIEVPPFDPTSGQQLLLELVRADVIQDANEARYALELSQQLDGHALALSFVGGLVNTNSWSIHEFLVEYERNKRAVHKLDRLGSLWAIWKVAFASLREPSSTILGILAYINPDSIPEVIFTQAKEKSLPACLKCCSGSAFALSGIVEDLITLALVKKDGTSRAFSLHRLVQTQFRYYLDSTRRQEAFDNTVKLLFDGFGTFQGQFYDKWKNCQMYIQQIISLKNHFNAEREEKEREGGNEEEYVKPTVRFCWLFTNAARFLLETANYAELEDVLSVAGRAFNLLTEAEKQQGVPVRCSILSNTGLLHAHRGFFDLSLPKIEECYKFRCEMKEQDWAKLSWIEVAMGNVLSSAGKFEDGLKWQLKAEETRRKVANDVDDVKSTAVIHQNIGRCHALLGQFDEADQRLQLAKKEFEGSKNWGMLAYTLFALANIERRRNKHTAAKEGYEKARSIWVSGGQLETHQFNGACMYKLGCVCDDVGDIENAVKHLRDALIVAKLNEEAMPGDYARVLHKLSQVLAKNPGTEVEATEKAVEALRVRMGRKLSIQSSKSNESEWSIVTPKTVATESWTEVPTAPEWSGEDSEETYDGLVYVLWR